MREITARFSISNEVEQEINRIAERAHSISFMDFEEAKQAILQVLSYNPQRLIDAYEDLSKTMISNRRMYSNNWRKMHGLPMIRRK
jgi:DNA replicative helicase MCM subunit Mcm2 (Cdc46/Mcm family)